MKETSVCGIKKQKSSYSRKQTQFHVLLNRRGDDFAWGEFSAWVSNTLSAYMTFLSVVYIIFKVKPS